MHFLSILLMLALAAAPPRELRIPVMITVHHTVGMAPMTLRVKAQAEAEGKEVCVVVNGPESFQSCRTLDGITWTVDFLLQQEGTYSVIGTSERYRTPAVTVIVS